MRIGRAVLTAVLAVAAGYGAAKGYVYYKTRAVVERAIELAAILGEIEYGTISSTLHTGTVQVERLTFEATGVPDTVTIRTLSLSTGNFMGLLNLARQSGGKEPPAALSVRFDDLNVDTDGALLRLADRLSQTAAASAGVPQTNPNCGHQPTEGFAILSRLGYEALTADGEISYRLDRASGNLVLDTGFEVDDMVRVKTRMVLAAGNGIPDFSGPPALKELDLRYKDLGYKDRLRRFCTQAAKIGDAAYVQAELDYGMFSRQFGIVPGPGLREAYRNFLETPNAEWHVVLRPNEGFDPRGISLYRPEDVLWQLNAALAVNDRAIEDLSFRYGEPPPVRPAPEPPREIAAPASPLRAPSGPPVRIDRPPTEQPYRTIPVGELGRYLHHYVRLQEPGRQPREGVLTDVTGGVALVERRYDTGKITVKVPLRRIAQAEVRR